MKNYLFNISFFIVVFVALFSLNMPQSNAQVGGQGKPSCPGTSGHCFELNDVVYIGKLVLQGPNGIVAIQ